MPIIDKLQEIYESESVLGFGFVCGESDQGIRISVGADGKATLAKRYIGPAEQAVDFLRRALGGWFEVEDGDPGEVEYLPPYRYPKFNFLVATSGEIALHGALKPDPLHIGEMEWNDATVTINFETTKHDTEGDEANRTLSVRTANDIIEIEGAKAKYRTSGRELDAAFPVENNCIELRYSVTKCPGPNTANYELLNRVNNATFLGKPAGTILFADYQEDIESKGFLVTPEYKREYVLKYKPDGHNKELDKETMDFDDVDICLPG